VARIKVVDLVVDETLDAKALGLIRGGRGALPRTRVAAADERLPVLRLALDSRSPRRPTLGI
jgi:hypothetical protein